MTAVEAAIRRVKRPEARQRYTAICLLHMGHQPDQIVEMQAVSIPTVYSPINR